MTTASVMLVCYLMLLLFNLFNGCNARLTWEQTLRSTMYSNVGIAGNPRKETVRFAVSTWLNDPKQVEVFASDSTNSTTSWTYEPSKLQNTESTLAVTTSRHIDKTSAGAIDLVVAHRFQKQNVSTCFLVGFSSNYPKPAWQYSLKGSCAVDLSLEGDSKPTIAMSDDGSTAVFAVSVDNLPQLHCVDAQTGAQKFVYSLYDQKPGTNSVSLSRDGSRIAYSNGLVVYVIDGSTGTLLTHPIVRQMPSDVHICPMGIFLLYAVNKGSTIQRWNATAQKFQVTPYQPKTPPDGPPNSWIAVSHRTSVNGGGGSPAGCLAAIGWLGMGSNQGVAKVVVMSMINGKVYVDWTSNKGAGYENFPVMAMHLGYTVLGLWGNGNSASPTILLFHNDLGNSTLMEYVSSGSVMAVDIVYTPFDAPSLLSTVTSSVHIIAGSKLEHATIPGIGGQCLVFQVPVNSTIANGSTTTTTRVLSTRNH